MRIFTIFRNLDNLSRHVLVNRLALYMGEEAPYDLNEGFEEEIQAVYDDLNQNEENPDNYFTLDNCLVCTDGEIAKFVEGSGYQGTGCYVNDEL